MCPTTSRRLECTGPDMDVLPKSELKRIMKKFFQDKDRGISISLFADLCGVHEYHLRCVFIDESEPLTEMVQRRASKAYNEWRAGNVRVMRNRDKTKFVEYRKQAQPPIVKSMGLSLTAEGIKVTVGLKNRHDYSDITLEEALRG